jgi:hypothetical protein
MRETLCRESAARWRRGVARCRRQHWPSVQVQTGKTRRAKRAAVEQGGRGEDAQSTARPKRPRRRRQRREHQWAKGRRLRRCRARMVVAGRSRAGLCAVRPRRSTAARPGIARSIQRPRAAHAFEFAAAWKAARSHSRTSAPVAAAPAAQRSRVRAQAPSARTAAPCSSMHLRAAARPSGRARQRRTTSRRQTCLRPTRVHGATASDGRDLGLRCLLIVWSQQRARPARGSASIHVAAPRSTAASVLRCRHQPTTQAQAPSDSSSSTREFQSHCRVEQLGISERRKRRCGHIFGQGRFGGE